MSSDSDFVPEKSCKRRKISRPVQRYLEELEESSDDKNINLWENLSTSSEECEQPAGTCRDSNEKGVNDTFDLGLTQLINSPDDTDDDVPLSERLKRKKHMSNPFPNTTDSDASGFSGFLEEPPCVGLITSTTVVEIHTSTGNNSLPSQPVSSHAPLSVEVGLPSDIDQGEYDKYIEHFKTLSRLSVNLTSSEDACLQFLKVLSLIPPDTTACPKCRKSKRKGVLKYREVTEKDRKCNLRLICSGGGACKYKVSPFTGTFFDGNNCRLPIGTVLTIIYCFLHGFKHTDAARECEVSNNTITDWYNYCREVCTQSLAENSVQIGGVGEVVEIDESKFYRRKYNRGRVLSAQQDGWVFGGIQRSNGDCFMVRVGDRSKNTLFPLILKYIKPGTQIISDEWKAYSKLNEIGYKHRTVCHKRNFVAPENPTIHTQNIECSWRYAKATYPERYTSESLRDGYLQEYLYRRKYKGPNFIHQFFKDIAKLYKHPAL